MLYFYNFGEWSCFLFLRHLFSFCFVFLLLFLSSHKRIITMHYWARFVSADPSPVIVPTSFCFHIKGVSAASTSPFLFSLGLSYRCLVIGSIILHYRNMCIHYKLRYTYKGKHRKTWFLFFWVWDTLLDIFLSRCIHFPANFIFSLWLNKI